MDQTATAGENAPVREPYSIGLTGDRYRGSEYSRGLKLIDSGDQNRKRVERRAQKRFHVKKNAFAIVRSNRIDPIRIKEMSMGEIALAVIKSDPLKLGRIQNLSKSGLAFRYIDNGKEEADASIKLDILLACYGFYLEDLPFTAASDSKVAEDVPFSVIKMRQMGGRFSEMKREQVSKLRYFIRHHTCGEV